MAVVESITKPLGGLSAILDHFGNMVGVARFFLDLRIVVEMTPKPAWRHLGFC